jgi:C-terminal processing protease CtpA/Prc
LGYGFASCHGCASVLVRNGVPMPRFWGQPALHQIRADGPAAGRIMEGDTLIAVDGIAIATDSAAIRLGTYRSAPVRLTLRRNGAERTVSVTASRVCVSTTSTERRGLDLTGGMHLAIEPREQIRLGDSALAYDRAARVLHDRVYGELTQRYASPLASFMSARGPLGLGIQCGQCFYVRLGDRWAWRFSDYPVVSSVEPGSAAARAGLRRGDELRTVDNVAITSAEGGDRFTAAPPDSAIRITWVRDGKLMFGTLSLSSMGNATMTQSVGNAVVELRGDGATWTRDDRTGELRIRVDSVTIIVRPTVPPR